MRGLLLILFVMIASLAQCQLADSLLNAASEQEGEQKIKTQLRLLWYYSHYDTKAGLELSEEVLKSAEKTKDIKLLARAEFWRATLLFAVQKHEESEQLYFSALEKFESIKDTSWILASKNQIGYVFSCIDKYEEGVKILFEVVDVCEKGGWDKEATRAYGSLGFNYKMAGQIEAAKKYFEKYKEYAVRIGSTSEEYTAYNELGNIYNLEGNYNQALKSHETALQLMLKSNAPAYMLGYAYNDIATDYYRLKQLDKALIFFEKSLEIAEDGADDRSLAASYANMGEVLFELKRYNEAEIYIAKSLVLAERHDLLLQLQTSHHINSMIYEQQGDFRQSLYSYKTYIKYKDSIAAGNLQSEIAAYEQKYQAAARQLEIDTLRKNEELSAAKMTAQENELNRKNAVLAGVCAGLGLMLVLAFLIYRGYRQKKQANIEISEQKAEVENQKIIVEEKNKEILDSITYAKRIQAAILPPNKIVKEFLNESFILYLPKDIVAGDFYWMENSNDHIMFAVADCTGHGVPGAMVSVVCNNGLNRSVRERGLTEPAAILDSTRDIVVEEFEKSEEEVMDGMDIALCSMHGNELKFAGANNPLWVIPDHATSVEEVIVLAPDKQPIGKYEYSNPFTSHQIQLDPGSSIYLFSDGFPDQFGGPKGKKFKYRPFKELLLSIKDLPMEEQKDMLIKTFEDWRGEHEQVDDVCVIGVRI